MNIHQYPGDIFYASREFSDEEARDLLRFPCWVFVKNSTGKIVKHIGYNKDGEKAFIQYGEGSGSNITHTHQLINDGEAESPVDKFARESQVSNKLDKPSPSTTQDIIYLVRRKLESEPDYLPVTINAQRVPVWTGYTFMNSPIYIGTMNSTVGINKSNPSEALDVNGNVRADTFIYNVTTANTVPNKDWTDGARRYFTDKNGVNYTLAFDEQNIKTVSTNISLDNSYHNCIVRITSSITITVPTGLRADFNCVFDTIGGVSATFLAGSGITISAPYGYILRDNQMCTIYKTASANYRLNGGLMPN